MLYHIESSAGADFGTWEANSKAEALLKNHREAGYSEKRVWLEDGELCFCNDEYRNLLGDVGDWHITEAETTQDA